MRHSRVLWILLGLVGALSIYALVGFKLMPWLIRYEATKYVHEEYGRRLGLGEIKVHPFKLNMEIKDISLPDRDQKRLFTLGRIFVDFQVFASISKLSWTFHEVSMSKPAVRAIIRPNGGLNLADLKGKPDPEEDKDHKLPRVWIEFLSVDHGKLTFIDRARRKPFEQLLAAVSFTLENFRTTAEGGDFQFAATAAEGSHIAWKGNVAMAPHMRVDGQARHHGLPRSRRWRSIVGDALPFGVPRGKLDLRASYRAVLDKQPEAQVHVSQLTATALSLRARGEHDVWVKLPHVTVSDAVAVLHKRSVEVAKVAIKEPHVDAKVEEGGKVNLMRLFSPEKQAAVAAPLQHASKHAGRSQVRTGRCGWPTWKC